MDVRDIIKSRRLELKLSQLDVARACGVSEATVSRWESGDIGDMKRSRIASLSKILKLSPSVIVGDLDEEVYSKIGLDFFRIPLFSSRICCGDGAFAEDDILEYIPVPSKGMSSPDDYFCQIASGDSMKDAGIEDGDILVFEKTSQVHNGMIGAFCIDENEAVCKKYKRIHNLIVLQPMNSDYEPIIIDPADENFRCVGKLKKSIKDFERE